jgi:flagellar motility protein MotE (MotC chaperone)
LKSIRLLPVVIFAALALLAFKGIGLVTNGGYVLTGPVAVVAAEGGEAAAESTDSTVSLPADTMMTDSSPTLGDTAPTLAAQPEPPAGTEGAASSAPPAGEHEAPAPSSAENSASAEPAVVCPETGAAPSTPSAPSGLDDRIGGALVRGCPNVAIPTTGDGDAVATVKDGSGKIVPLAAVDEADSQGALLDRLSERRAELDKRSTDLDMREALVAAAEQRLTERSTELQGLEAKITALVDEKQAAEDAQFKAVVGMYSQMKPKDAAKIFDNIDMNVLLRIARAMNPRNMAPILAAMNAGKAQGLTTAMAAPDTKTVADAGGGGENLAALPQIVGH